MAQSRDECGKFAAGSAVGDHQRSQTPGAGHGHPVMAQYDGAKSVGTHAPVLGNLGKAALGVAAGAAGTLGKSALRSQGHGGRR